MRMSDHQTQHGFPPENFDAIRNSIREKYKQVAVDAASLFRYPTGREGALALGYDAGLLQNLGENFVESFCGVGNPFALGPVNSGETLLDIGCGAGFDLLVASRLVGVNGCIRGIDLSVEMIEKAARNLVLAGVFAFEVKHVDSEVIPYNDETFDVVVSNGVINLSPDKEVIFREIHRVLNPGGRLQFADMVLERELPAALAGSLDAWSQ
jgi:arsenite methyltransferase